METLTDNQIMLRVKAGELDQMALLFQRYRASLYRFLLFSCREREGSEDMVQTVFYRMLQYRHTFTGQGELVTWMYHLARNVLKDHARKQDRRGINVSLEELTDSSSGTGDEHSLEQNEAQQRLYRAIDSLPNKQREVIVYYCLQELRHKEIAEILGIREDAVRARLYRGMKELKACYQKLEA